VQNWCKVTEYCSISRIKKEKRSTFAGKSVIMNKKSLSISQIKPSILQELFETKSLDDRFFIFDDFKDVIFRDNKINDDIYNFPYRASETIVVLCTHGDIDIKLNMKNIKLKKDSVFVLLPNQIFELKDISIDFKGIVFVMKNSFFDFWDNTSEIKIMQQYILKEQGLQLSEDAMQEFIAIYHLIKNKIAEQNIFLKQIIQHYCSILFYNLYSIIKQNELQQVSNKIPNREYIFEQFIKLVEQHYKEEHEIGFYADKLCLTSKYLSTLVREASGKSAAIWIREYLLLEARTLLKSGQMSIQQISNLLNFNDQSHFGNFFKRYAGCSPREYQRQ
jgi:AraC-like DNA-binding protein